MVVLSWVAWGVRVRITLSMMLLLARGIGAWIPFFVRGWRPRGIVLVVANVLYALTDPPVRWIGRFIPPVRIGDGMTIDIGFLLLFLVLIVAQRFVTLLYFISQ